MWSNRVIEMRCVLRTATPSTLVLPTLQEQQLQATSAQTCNTCVCADVLFFLLLILPPLRVVQLEITNDSVFSSVFVVFLLWIDEAKAHIKPIYESYIGFIWAYIKPIYESYFSYKTYIWVIFFICRSYIHRHSYNMSVGVMEDYKLRDLRASHTLGWSWNWNT